MVAELPFVLGTAPLPLPSWTAVKGQAQEWVLGSSPFPWHGIPDAVDGVLDREEEEA